MEVSPDNFVDMVYLLSYMGRIEDAITNTIVWRNQFGIMNFNVSKLWNIDSHQSVQKSNLCYCVRAIIETCETVNVAGEYGMEARKIKDVATMKSFFTFGRGSYH